MDEYKILEIKESVFADNDREADALRASLKERFRIMCRYYGTIPTLLRHIRFLLRHLKNK